VKHQQQEQYSGEHDAAEAVFAVEGELASTKYSQ
jgi:hypothetical protein